MQQGRAALEGGGWFRDGGAGDAAAFGMASSPGCRKRLSFPCVSPRPTLCPTRVRSLLPRSRPLRAVEGLSGPVVLVRQLPTARPRPNALLLPACSARRRSVLPRPGAHCSGCGSGWPARRHRASSWPPVSAEHHVQARDPSCGGRRAHPALHSHVPPLLCPVLRPNGLLLRRFRRLGASRAHLALSRNGEGFCHVIELRLQASSKTPKPHLTAFVLAARSEHCQNAGTVAPVRLWRGAAARGLAGRLSARAPWRAANRRSRQGRAKAPSVVLDNHGLL